MVINNENGISKFFSKVYFWMFIGLLVSGGVAYYTSITPSFMYFTFKNIYLIMILEIGVVIAFTALRSKVSPLVAKILFVIYSIVSGVTLSSIFLIYKLESVGMVFFASAVMFGLLALYGYTTKTNLSTFGRIMLFGLITIIVMSLINMFIGNSNFSIIISIFSIIIFLGLTAWDMQKLKSIYEYYSTSEEELNKVAIYGALDLYLDFINIFLQLLSLFGKRRD